LENCFLFGEARRFGGHLFGHPLWEGHRLGDVTPRCGVNLENLGEPLSRKTIGGADQRRAQVYLALYENNLATVVKAGENKGLTLRHDFVVRSLA
jgi:hypothetical protein